MDRRTALQLVAIGALAAPTGAGQTLRFFTAEENQLLDQAMELIIPADEHSPGAHAAKVSVFADWMVSHAPEKVQQRWREDLRRLKESAENSSLANALAAESRGPSAFFTRLKDMTIDGYYTSEVGIHQDLNYQGNAYVVEFRGCDHKEHQG